MSAPLLDSLTSLPRRVLMGLVRAYQLIVSPWLGGSCRFEPTCSAYSLQVLQTFGAAAGTYMTLTRVVRCHPFCEGGHDPLPGAPPPLFRRLLAVSVAVSNNNHGKSPSSTSTSKPELTP
jgi:putative membrane protein insertion efficiency factor